MMLPALVRSQVLFHLAYTQAAPAADRAAAERAFDSVPDQYTQDKVVFLVNSCEEAWGRLATPPLFEEEREVEVGGSASVTTSVSRLPSRASLNRSYFLLTQQLATAFGIRNFRDEASMPTLEGALYINSIPGAKGDRGERGPRAIYDAITAEEAYLNTLAFN